MANDTSLEVEAIFITVDGIPFLGNAKSPHENFVQRYCNDQLTDYVFFGHFKNRLIYHEIEIERTRATYLH